MSSTPTRWQVPTNGTGDDQDVFPFLRGQSYLQLKTPVWSSKVDVSVAGVERRRALWSYPIWKFKLAWNVLRDGCSYQELQRVFSFFSMKAGSFANWFYFDPYDNAVSAQPIGVGDGTTTTFQLTRTISVGGFTFTEPVRGIYGTPTVTVAGTATSTFTIGQQGTITFTTAPSAGQAIAWTGQFFFLCRFSTDQLDIQQRRSGQFSASGIEFQTVKS